MRYSECECGKTQWFGSDPPKRCQRCSYCDTNAWKETPEPHEYTPRFSSSTGKPKGGMCKKCYRRDPEWPHPQTKD